MLSQIRPAVVVFIALTGITGVVYPIAVTAVAQAAFPRQANGSIIIHDGKAIGSSLIGQEFGGQARYFWGRLSATGPVPYTPFNADSSTGSSGSNVGPTNPVLVDSARKRLEALHAAEAAAGITRPAGQRVPIDLVTASGSGLDPHISPAAAEYQVPRVAKSRGLSEDAVRAVVAEHTRARVLGLLGEPVVNVLELNLALDSAR